MLLFAATRLLLVAIQVYCFRIASRYAGSCLKLPLSVVAGDEKAIVSAGLSKESGTRGALHARLFQLPIQVRLGVVKMSSETDEETLSKQRFCFEASFGGCRKAAPFSEAMGVQNPLSGKENGASPFTAGLSWTPGANLLVGGSKGRSEEEVEDIMVRLLLPMVHLLFEFCIKIQIILVVCSL